jgi:uncharacterized protein YdeI (YjbR/CyaY-like superfamily)
MDGLNPRVTDFLNKAEKWRDELEKLRTICLDCGLTEELKWNVPIYTYRQANVVGMNGLKDSCALSFFKGALLQDAESLLLRPGEHTQVGRWMKFTSVDEIARLEPVIKAYIYEAIEVERAGIKLPKNADKLVLVEELQKKLDEFPALKAAFAALTPGRQRGYNLYFSAPKQSKTREARIEKFIPQILSGKGMID